MTNRRSARLAAVATLAILTLMTGCVRRAAVRQPENNRPAAEWSDEFLRAMFQQQTRGAFDPLTDDRRVRLLQSHLRLSPSDVTSRMELAAVYENYRQCDDALEQYAEVLRRAASAATGDAIGEKAVAGLGRCARISRRSAEAIPVLEAFLMQRPSAGSFNELGLLYDAMGDLAGGERALREAVSRAASRNEESDRLHNNLGYNLLLQNKAEAAETEFRRALELNPKSATSRNNLGAVLVRRGDLAGALEQFQATADAATAHNNVAVVLLEMGQYEQSRGELVKALAIRRNFAPAMANFKLVQERIRGRVETPKAGSLPVNRGPAPSALVALTGAASPNQQERAESKTPED